MNFHRNFSPSKFRSVTCLLVVQSCSRSLYLAVPSGFILSPAAGARVHSITLYHRDRTVMKTTIRPGARLIYRRSVSAGRYGASGRYQRNNGPSSPGVAAHKGSRAITLPIKDAGRDSVVMPLHPR